jgi:CDGSH-type Zn-finger protein
MAQPERTVNMGRLPKDAVSITPCRDGPLLVRGPVRLIGSNGAPISCQRDPIALCRCGRSQVKPFCDGTHKLVGFRAPAQPAPVPETTL